MGGPGPTPSVTLAETLDVFRGTDGSCTPLTASEIATELGCARRTAHRKLEQLAERGDIETKKVGARSRVWWHPSDAIENTEDADEPAYDQFADFVTAVEDYAIFTLDPDGHIVTWNDGAKRIKGYDEDEIVGEHFSTFYTEDDTEHGVPTENLEIADNQGRLETEGWRVRKDGSEFWANIVITAIHDDEGELRGFTKVTRDLTERKRTEDERRLHHSVSTAIGHAVSVEEGFEAAIEHICELTEWDYGEVWLPENDHLERVPITPSTTEPFDEFAEASDSLTFEPGEGLIGRVWETGESEWISDVSAANEADFERAALAEEVGCNATLGVPIVADEATGGVLLFALTEPRSVDDRLIDIVESVAADLGGLLLRKEAEEALRHEQELLDSVFQASPVGMTVLESDGTITHSNPRAEEYLGLSTERNGNAGASGRTLLDENGDPVPQEERPYMSVFETGEPVYDWEGQVALPGGRRWISVTTVPLDDGEPPEQVVVAVKDITKVKEQARRLSRQRDELESELEEVYERVEDAFYALDDQWRFTHINEQAEELIERDRDAVVGQTVWDAFPGARDSIIWERYHEAMETQEPVSFELFSEPLDFWAEVNAYPSETGLSVYFRDITERKQREQELERYETIVETIWDGVYALDTEDRFVMVNEAFLEMTGYDRAELMGKPGSVVHNESVNEKAAALSAEVVSGEREGAVLELDLETADGETIPVESRFGPYEYDDGSYARTGVVRDITERREREQALRESEERYRSLTDDVLDTSQVGTFILDEDFEVVWMNQAMETYFELDRETIIGRDKRAVIEEEIADILDEPDQFIDLVTATYEDNTYTEEFECHVLSGENRAERWLKHWSQPIESGLYSGGRIEHYTDITERKEREQELMEDERIIETVDDGVYVLNEAGEFQRVNEAFVSMTNIDRSELLGSPAEVVFGEKFQEIDERARQRIESGEIEVATFEEEIFPADAASMVVENRFRLFEIDGEWGRVGVVRDITERKEYERELRRYETLIEESTDVNAIIDADGTIQYVTPSAGYVLGYGRDELVGESAFEFVHEDDRDQLVRDFGALTDGTEERTTSEFRFRTDDGSWVWLESRGRDLRSDPRIDGLVVYTRDITDRKEYEIELESRARQQAVISELGHDALVDPELDDLFERATRLVAETLDTDYCKVLDLDPSADELRLRQGVGWRDGFVGSATVPNDDGSQAGYTLIAEEPIVVTDLEDDDRFSGPKLLTTHDVTSGISTIIGSSEDPWGILGAHDTESHSFSDEDVDFIKSVANVLAAAIERQSYQAELENLVEKLEESNQRLEQFAYITSHDLQEPLRMISSYLSLLEDRYADRLDDDAEEFIDFAVDGAERMREMINGLLEYSRLDTRAEPFEPTDTESVVENVLANLQVQIEENDAEVEVEPLPTVIADANQLEQVFQNLVSNAIKYRGDDPPDIEIGAERSGDEWVFTVEDNGIGIDPEHAERIFEVFDRLHSHDEYPGTGIGLALCEKIVERHDGDIWVDSEPGEGSTFYFTIPTTQETGDHRSGPSASAGLSEVL